MSRPVGSVRGGAAALVCAGVLLAAGCSDATPAPAPGAPSVAPGDPSATAPGAPPVDPADVTCENMLDDATVDSFLASGWTVREDPFVILDLELPDGRSCTWGDFSSPTNDDLVLFGWSPIAASDATAVQAALLAEGWRSEESPGGIIVTEDPEFALRLDDQGYGVTYLFADGWVEVSDTRQGLDLIDLG